MSPLLIIIVGLIAIDATWITLSAAWIYYHVQIAKGLVAKAKPFERSGTKGSILVLGDSIAYGTGTTSPQRSLAGVFASHFPGYSVRNLAVNGKKTAELAAEIQGIDESYDLILIVIGGNDVIRVRTKLNQTAKNLGEIYAFASEHGKQTVALSTGNFKYTTLFPWPLKLIFSERSIRVRDAAKKSASQYPNVHYIDMVEYNEQASFSHVEEAPDRLHLSDAGVQYWMSGVLEATDDLKFKGK